MESLELLVRLKDEASKGLDQLQNKLGMTNKQLVAAGAGLTGLGVGIAAAMGMAVKAAAEEEAGIIKLSTALENVGVNYDAVSASLEAAITATQKKTSVADDQQREALAALVSITGSYNQALKLLPLALDLAIGKEMDLTSAAELVGRVSQGNTSILARYGIQLKEGATATEALGMMTDRFSGQAEAFGKSTSGQMATLKNTIGDVVESFGTILLPILEKVIGVVQQVVEWFGNLPGPVKTVIVVVGGLVAGVALLVGPLLMILGMLPAITTGIGLFGAVMSAAIWPVTLVVAAVAALVAIGIVLWKNWEKIADFFKDIWTKIKGFFWDAVKWIRDTFLKFIKFILDGLSTILGWVPGLGDKIKAARDAIARMLQEEPIQVPIEPVVTGWTAEEGAAYTAAVAAQAAENAWMTEAGMPVYTGEELLTPTIPMLQHGALVTRPTLAMIGEAGPEVVAPLGKIGGTNITIQAGAFLGNEADARRFARLILDQIRQENRQRTYGRLA